jgi:serine/threonine protein kinase
MLTEGATVRYICVFRATWTAAWSSVGCLEHQASGANQFHLEARKSRAAFPRASVRAPALASSMVSEWREGLQTMSITQKTIIAKYQLVECLGRGGSAEVWKAFDPSLERFVALKILHPAGPQDDSFRERFIREARVAAHLNHPNIVPVFDFSARDEPAGEASPGSGPDSAYMIMQYVEGQTLAEYLGKTSQVGVFPPAEVLVTLFAAVALALDYAHAQGVVHRDVKPANILLDRWNTVQHPMGAPLLTDFGMVKLLGTHAQTLAHDGLVVGTPLYISPEQAQGLPVTGSSDIYSLGVILYEAFTGVHPYVSPYLQQSGQHTVAYLLQHVYAAPRHPCEVNPDLPPAAGEVLLRSLAKDPAARFPCASALVAALAEALSVPVPEQLIPLLAAAQAEQLAREVTPPRAGGPVTPFPPGMEPAPGPEQSHHRGWGRGRLRLRNRQRLLLALVSVALLIVAVLSIALSAGVGTRGLSGAPLANTAVGAVSFLSSGQGDPTRNLGVDDEVQIDLRQLPAPPAGESYYAWLLSDASVSDGQAILLGKLALGTQGQVSLTYRGDGQHTNLLAGFSQFLVTAESSQVTPVTPALDRGNWRYYGEIPQQPNPSDTAHHYSLLDHLRHLLAQDPELNALGLPGGLSYWLSTNTDQVRGLAASTPASWSAQNTIHLRRQLVRVLDYLDGAEAVGADLPAGTPLLVDPHLARVGLLEFNPAVDNPPGYIYHVASHLRGLDSSPGRTDAQHALALEIVSALDVVRQELERARLDAKQLLGLDDARLLSPSTLPVLNDLVKQTALAFGGQSQAGGVVWIHARLQGLATIPVYTYPPPP